jgi:hypothetical protein
LPNPARSGALVKVARALEKYGLVAERKAIPIKRPPVAQLEVVQESLDPADAYGVTAE